MQNTSSSSCIILEEEKEEAVKEVDPSQKYSGRNRADVIDKTMSLSVPASPKETVEIIKAGSLLSSSSRAPFSSTSTSPT